MKKNNIEFNYEKLLEERVEELTTELSKSLSRELDLQEQLKTKHYYILGVTTAVNDQYINMEIMHHLFEGPLSACNRLKNDWKRLRDDFKLRFESRGFVFKYYTLDSYNVYHGTDKSLRLTIEKSWSFETRKEVEITIKTLKQ